MAPLSTRNVHDEVVAVLQRHVTRAEGPPPMTVELENLGVDSMKAIDLLLDIEEQLAIAIPDDQITRENFATGERIVALIAALLDCDAKS